MKLGVMTDIHGNIEALDVALRAFDEAGIEEIWSLGDMVAMGPDSNEVMARLLDRGVHMISGNHDEAVVSLLSGMGHPESYAHTRPHHEWVAQQLRPDYVDVLAALPRTISTTIDEQRLFGIHYHIPVDKRNAAIVEEPFHDIVDANLENMQRLFGHYDADLVLFGHHHPVHLFEDERKKYVNPGALGVAKDDLARFAIMTVEEEGLEVDLKALPYDKRSFLEKMERYEVPQRDVMLRLFY